MSYREIKFRAKDVFSEKWHYGVYIPAEFTTWREPSISDGHRRTEIDLETIGQYTGCKDAGGTEIYEGDVIQFPHRRKEEVGIVYYADGVFKIKNRVD